MRNVTVQEENAVIDSIGHAEFFAVALREFGAVNLASLMGWASLYGLTGKGTPTEARAVLVGWGFGQQTVFDAYQNFRRLRRALLAGRGIAMHERRGGPGANDGIPQVVFRLRDLQTAPDRSIMASVA